MTLRQLPDAGTHSEALSSRCTQTCWVSGHADGKVALWSFDPAHADATAMRDSTLPSMDIDTDGPGPRTVLWSERPGVLFSHAGSTKLLVKDSANGWQTFRRPGWLGTWRDQRGRPALCHHPGWRLGRPLDHRPLGDATSMMPR